MSPKNKNVGKNSCYNSSAHTSYPSRLKDTRSEGVTFKSPVNDKKQKKTEPNISTPKSTTSNSSRYDDTRSETMAGCTPHNKMRGNTVMNHYQYDEESGISTSDGSETGLDMSIVQEAILRLSNHVEKISQTLESLVHRLDKLEDNMTSQKENTAELRKTVAETSEDTQVMIHTTLELQMMAQKSRKEAVLKEECGKVIQDNSLTWNSKLNERKLAYWHGLGVFFYT